MSGYVKRDEGFRDTATGTSFFIGDGTHLRCAPLGGDGKNWPFLPFSCSFSLFVVICGNLQ
jgi:hypothetical protein